MIPISVLNHKGGTGKTTVTLHLATALALKGKRTLVIDLDFQSNLSYWLLGEFPNDKLTITDALLQTNDLSDVILPTKRENLYIAPSNHRLKDFATLDPATVLYRMKKALRTVEDNYDFVLMDHAPNLTLVTLTGLVASQYSLVPVSCEILPIVGIRLLSDTLNQIRNDLEHNVNMIGYVLTMYDKRIKITAQVEQFMNQNFGDLLFRSNVRVNSKLKEAPGYQMTVYDIPDSKGIDDFNSISEEFLKRLEL